MLNVHAGTGQQVEVERDGAGDVECFAGGGDIVSGLDGFVVWTVRL